MHGTPILYLIAAPIGNLADISARALDIIRQTPLVAAEDTRRARRLLAAHGISGKKILSLRAHNENHAAAALIEKMAVVGAAVYLADAGTPGISDPGGRLVRAVRAAGMRVSPIPGASALSALLSVAGTTAETTHFFGFAPRAKGERRRFFAELPTFAGNIVLFEAPLRVADTVAHLREFFGDAARAVVGREITKLHEQIVEAPLAEIAAALAAGDIPARGEFSLLLESPGQKSPLAATGQALFDELCKELPPRRAAALAARLGGDSAAAYYRRRLTAKK